MWKQTYDVVSISGHIDRFYQIDWKIIDIVFPTSPFSEPFWAKHANIWLWCICVQKLLLFDHTFCLPSTSATRITCIPIIVYKRQIPNTNSSQIKISSPLKAIEICFIYFLFHHLKWISIYWTRLLIKLPVYNKSQGN